MLFLVRITKNLFQIRAAYSFFQNGLMNFQVIETLLSICSDLHCSRHTLAKTVTMDFFSAWRLHWGITRVFILLSIFSRLYINFLLPKITMAIKFSEASSDLLYSTVYRVVTCKHQLLLLRWVLQDVAHVSLIKIQEMVHWYRRRVVFRYLTSVPTSRHTDVLQT